MALSGRGRELCPPGLRTSEEIGLEGLLGRLQPEAERLAVAGEGAAAGIGVQRELGLGPLAPFGRAQLGALALRFLVAGEQDDDVAVRLEARRLELQQRDERRDQPALVVARSAAVEIAVLLDELERVGRPVGAAAPRPRPCARGSGSACASACRPPASGRSAPPCRSPGTDVYGIDVDVAVGPAGGLELVGEIGRELRILAAPGPSPSAFRPPSCRFRAPSLPTARGASCLRSRLPVAATRSAPAPGRALRWTRRQAGR